MCFLEYTYRASDFMSVSFFLLSFLTIMIVFWIEMFDRKQKVSEIALPADVEQWSFFSQLMRTGRKSSGYEDSVSFYASR